MSQFRISNRFSWKKLTAGYVVLDLEKGCYFTLNDTASLIWDGLIAGKSAEAIAESLAVAYEVTPARAHEDVRETIATLTQESILETV